MKLAPILVLLGCAAAVTLFVARADDAKPAAKPAKKTAAKSVAKMQLPRVESADLNGDGFVLPDDLSAPRTLLLVAFEREHQDLIDGWVSGLKLKPSDQDWFELPVVGKMSPMRQKSLDRAMRDGINSKNERARVVTLYTDRKKFVAPLGKTKTDTIYVIVAGKNGEVLSLQAGAFDQQKAAKVGKLWRAKK